MKAKDLSVIASIITFIFGLAMFAMWDSFILSYPAEGILAAAAIYLGYAWSSYSRSKGHEKSKRVCLYISSAVLIILALAKRFDIDFAFWIVLVVLDVKLRYSTIKD